MENMRILKVKQTIMIFDHWVLLNIFWIKEREVDAERVKIEQIKIAGEEKRKAIQEETQQRQRQADYQDKLARKRYDEQLAQQVIFIHSIVTMKLMHIMI